uniref:Uncharacterized protein n=1 Tax=Candidatus Kentrum sp. FM TaxID=2126340 RepID=A0A450SPM1_9GAMM|nr:MAG: hypothetical protein BECKFM1743C_GA0114222_100394 [Candidatus Kentron sp. FM]VFJ55877.1 MAG: hypothetical protein BECKFM1743A_GA0114220_101574 [Candidatus Kentron sp. FM]VFK07123.1 MAG: hypothetical protein BECKFM1743B_GA0114221_100325 [Candidatus Kentron sp. FM]
MDDSDSVRRFQQYREKLYGLLRYRADAICSFPRAQRGNPIAARLRCIH